MRLPSCASIVGGELYIAGCSAAQLAREYGTPLYVYDEQAIRGMCRAFADTLKAYNPGGRVFYASKAFPSLAVNRVVNEEGLGVDAASLGELEAALRAGVPPLDITLHGSNKSDEEIARAVEVRVGRIAIDSIEEVGRVEAEAASQNTRVDVLLRLNPGVEAETLAAVRTACDDTKFGVPIALGQGMLAARLIKEAAHLNFIGVHCHVGSHVHNLDCYPEAVDALLDFIDDARRELGVELDEIAMGGGFGVWYKEGDAVLDPRDCVRLIAERVEAGVKARSLNPLRLTIEPGRMIVAEACVALYTVGVVKDVSGIRTYVSIDGGFNENPRPLSYGAVYTAVLANRITEPHDAPVRVSGRACETDTVIDTALLPKNPRRGDILALLTSGAYQLAMAGNYQRTPKPCAVMIKDGRPRVIIRRQTVDDVLAQDVDG